MDTIIPIHLSLCRRLWFTHWIDLVWLCLGWGCVTWRSDVRSILWWGFYWWCAYLQIIFKSSTVSMWPVFLVILNLPATIRTNAEKLSAGPSKPNMKLLLKPLARQIDRLRLVVNTLHGPRRSHCDGNIRFTCSSVCQTIQWPAWLLGNKTLTYPPNTVYPLRSHSEIVRKAEASQNGISPLTSMINLVNSVPVDYMHAVLEGVTRWLAKSYKEPYYLGRKSADIDSELLKQTPPHEFNRPPAPPQIYSETPWILESIRTTYMAFVLLTTSAHWLLATAPLWTAGVCNS